MRKLAIVIALLFVLPPLSGVIHAMENVEARLVADKTEAITVGDVVPLTLEVTHPEGWRVVFPELAAKWGTVEVVSQSTPTINANADGTEITTQEIDVTMFAPGEHMTPPIVLTVVDTDGQTSRLEVDPIPLDVVSVLQEGDTTLRDIKPPAAFAQSVANPVSPLAMGLIVTLAVTAGAGLYLSRRPAKLQVDSRTPQQKALDRLAEIVTINLSGPSSAREQHAMVSACLREFLEELLGLSALEKTTPEIVHSLEKLGATTEYVFGIRCALRACDIVMYSSNDTGRHEIIQLTALVKSLIETSPFPETEETTTGMTKEATD